MHENIEKLIIHGPIDTWEEAREAVTQFLSRNSGDLPRNVGRVLMLKGATGTFFVSQRSTGTMTVHVTAKDKVNAGNTQPVENAELPRDGGGV